MNNVIMITDIQKMSNSYAPMNELQYPEMYASYSPQYQQNHENYIPLNPVAPDYVAIDMSIPPPPSYQDATNDIHFECRRKEEILTNRYKKSIEILKKSHQQQIDTIERNTKGSFFGGILFAAVLVGAGFLIYRFATMYW
jgi:hypothetical protein